MCHGMPPSHAMTYQ